MSSLTPSTRDLADPITLPVFRLCRSGWLFFIAWFLCSALGCRDTRPPPSIPLPNDWENVQSSRVRAAVEEAREAVTENPQSADAWGHLGSVYVIHEWRAEAELCFRQAIALDDDQFRWHHLLGRTLRPNNPQSACVAFRNALRIDPNAVPAHLLLADALNTIGKADEAREHLELVIQLDPSLSLAYLRLGELQLTAGKPDEACGHLETALQREPGLNEAHVGLARAYMALGNRERASQHAENAENGTEPPAVQDPWWAEVQRLGQTANWFAKRGSLYLKQGDYEQAAKELLIAAQETPDSCGTWMNLGAALLNIERYDQAREALEHAAALVRNLPSLSDQDREVMTPANRAGLFVNLGIACDKLGNATAAGDRFREALTHDHDCYAAHRELGRQKLASGKLLDAKRHLEHCQHIRPEESVARALEELELRLAEAESAADLVDSLRENLSDH